MRGSRVLALLGALACLAGLAKADYAFAKGSELWVNGVLVLTLRGASPRTRAFSAATRIRNAREGLSVSVRKLRRSAAVRLGSSNLLSISRAEAKSYGMTPVSLANRWASTLKGALALPPIKAVNTSVQVPIQGTRFIRVVGSKAHVAQAQSEPPGRFELKRKEGGFEVVGRSLGSGSIVLSAGQWSADVSADVLPLAAQFPQHLTALVSGLPAQEEIVRGAIEASVRGSLRTAKGAQLQLELPPLWVLSAGQARTVNVKVKAAASGAFASEGTAQVTIRNLGLGVAREEELWYSNAPENVKQPGTLMQGELAADKVVRLLYHHINESAGGMYFQVEAVNCSATEGKLLFIPGDSEPEKNPVLAGIVAGERFLKRWLTSSGEVIRIPPKSRVPLALRRLGPKETMSGLCSLWLLEDGPEKLEIKVLARPPQTAEAFFAGKYQTEAPWRFVESLPLSPNGQAAPAFEHVYPDPFQSRELAYHVGGKYGFARIGELPIVRHDQNGSLSGNFGVLYKLEVEAVNPTETPSDLEVLFEASAGYSGALFVLNGSVIRTPLLQPKTSARILKMKLVPGQSKRFDLYTMPLSGSSYPATVILRPIDSAAKVAVDLSSAYKL